MVILNLKVNLLRHKRVNKNYIEIMSLNGFINNLSGVENNVENNIKRDSNSEWEREGH